MKIRCLRALLLGVAIGSVAIAVGCGDSGDGDLVQVDEEQEKKVTKAMEEYYMKKQGPGQAR